MKNNFNAYYVFIFFLSKIPFNLFISVFSELIAQFFVVVSYFLPIKVIILLNSKSLPIYLASIFPKMSRNETILILTGFIFLFYGIGMLIDKYNRKLVLNSMNKLIGDRGINSKNKLIYKYIDNYFKFLSAFVLLIIIYIALLYLFPSVAFIFSLYLVLMYIISTLIELNEMDMNSFLKVGAGFGFMLVFIYEVVDILYIKTQEISLLVILLSVVIVRYLFTRGHYMLNKFIFVHKNMNKFYSRLTEVEK